MYTTEVTIAHYNTYVNPSHGIVLSNQKLQIFFARSHLSAMGDFEEKIDQDATFEYLNSTPGK